jgi:hypothetical protein
VPEQEKGKSDYAVEGAYSLVGNSFIGITCRLVEGNASYYPSRSLLHDQPAEQYPCNQSEPNPEDRLDYHVFSILRIV